MFSLFVSDLLSSLRVTITPALSDNSQFTFLLAQTRPETATRMGTSEKKCLSSAKKRELGLVLKIEPAVVPREWRT